MAAAHDAVGAMLASTADTTDNRCVTPELDQDRSDVQHEGLQSVSDSSRRNSSAVDVNCSTVVDAVSRNRCGRRQSMNEVFTAAGRLHVNAFTESCQRTAATRRTKSYDMTAYEQTVL